MFIEPFNLHHSGILFTEHVYILYILPSLRYQLFPYLTPFIFLNLTWPPRIIPHLRPTLPLFLFLPQARKIRINSLIPWMSGPLSWTLRLKSQQTSLLMSTATLQPLTIPTLHLTPLKHLKPLYSTSLNPFCFSLYLSHMKPKPWSFSWNASSRSSFTLPLPTNNPCLIQTNPFCLRLTLLSISSRAPFSIIKPTPPRPWILTQLSNMRLPLRLNVYRSQRTILLKL